MASMPSDVRLTSGTFDFSIGVDSSSPTTVKSIANPNGLSYQSLAWLSNATVRGGGITQRYGWQKLATVVRGGLYQAGYLYEGTGNPYLMLQIGGHIYQVRVDTDNSVHDLSTSPGLTNPPNIDQAFMTQGEQFLVIQAGDYNPQAVSTLPLFWDGNVFIRSPGLAGQSLPAALQMTYWQNRLWYAQGNIYTAGDIVGGASGSAQYKLTDAILHVTENPLATGGDGFSIPSQAGKITALTYTANLDATLGQGPLYISTRRQIYSLTVPVTRLDWIAAGTDNRPLQTVVQSKWGGCGDRCFVRVNGDLFYASMEPGVRSLFVSTRYFQQWGNTPISRNEQRVLKFTNPILMGTASGIEFDNRMLMTAYPIQTPAGVAFQAIMPLDFDLISTLQTKLPPAWEGIQEGLLVLQMFEGDFGGLQRGFAVVYNPTLGDIEVWEFNKATKTDNGDSRVTWQIETPAYTFNKEFELKQLDGGEIWIDSLSGTADIQVWYRPDADPCWQPWYQKQICAARTTCEDLVNPVCYPTAPNYCDGFKFPLVLPAPQPNQPESLQRRPTKIGYQFQVKIVIKGYCRVRGLVLYAIPRERQAYEGLNTQ